MTMNSIPNFDLKNPRDYPDYGYMPIAKDNLSTVQRIVKSFNAKVLFWTALSILAFVALFENPLLASRGNNLAEIRLLFVAGLVLGVCESTIWRKRRETNVAPRWRRIGLAIISLAALILAFYFLGNNTYILSLC